MRRTGAACLHTLFQLLRILRDSLGVASKAGLTLLSSIKAYTSVRCVFRGQEQRAWMGEFIVCLVTGSSVCMCTCLHVAVPVRNSSLFARLHVAVTTFHFLEAQTQQEVKTKHWSPKHRRRRRSQQGPFIVQRVQSGIYMFSLTHGV